MTTMDLFNHNRYFFSDLFLPLQVHTMMLDRRDVDDDDGDLLFSGHAYVDSDKTSTQAHNFYILIPLEKYFLANAYAER